MRRTHTEEIQSRRTLATLSVFLFHVQQIGGAIGHAGNGFEVTFGQKLFRWGGFNIWNPAFTGGMFSLFSFGEKYRREETTGSHDNESEQSQTAKPLPLRDHQLVSNTVDNQRQHAKAKHAEQRHTHTFKSFFLRQRTFIDARRKLLVERERDLLQPQPAGAAKLVLARCFGSAVWTVHTNHSFRHKNGYDRTNPININASPPNAGNKCFTLR